MEGAMIRLLVQNILARPGGFDWSVQGLGMMRLYLSDEVRLHIWDSALKVPGVSAIHSHPWNMKSTVVAGRYKQHRFLPTPEHYVRRGEKFKSVTIRCGEDACTMEPPVEVEMDEQKLEVYEPGETYLQSHDEIHLSCPEDGTVTLVERTFLEDRDHARVYWRGKGDWVDAKPRPATPDEVAQVTARALRTWF